MSMLKGVSLALFLAGCFALYLAVLMLVNPTLPGATSVGDSRIAYSVMIFALSFICCVISGLTWSHATTWSPSVSISCALLLWLVVLVVLCAEMGVGSELPL